MIKFLITKGGDTTINVGIPNKPYINGFRTILDKTEGFVYFAFLGYYDEAMQGDFDGAYMYPVLILRMQCENGGVPPENSVIQYAFGQYDDFDWNNSEVTIEDNNAHLMLEGLNWKTPNFNHEVIRKSVFDNSTGYNKTYIFETEIITGTIPVGAIPYQVTEYRVSNGDGMVTHAYVYRITENVTPEDIYNAWLNIKNNLSFGPNEIDDFLQSFYYAINQ